MAQKSKEKCGETMSTIKVENNFVWIILAAIRIYSTNFLKFCGYMLFPVLGQILGLLLIFCPAGLYVVHLPELAEKYPAFRDMSTITLCAAAIAIPGLLVFMKAFWDYLVAYGALNSVTEGFLTTGRIYDFPAHKATVTGRSIKYIVLWFLCSIFWIIAIIPFFWVIGAIFFIYFILIFQVFSFEPETSAGGCFKRSLQLIRGNWLRTLLIMLVIGMFTHVIFVQGFSVFFDFTGLTQFLSDLFARTLTGYIPIDAINDVMLSVNSSFDIITPAKTANFFVYQIIAFIVTGFTLPLRSVTWALWYIALGQNETSGGKRKTGGKRVQRKINPDIIDRAS